MEGEPGGCFGEDGTRSWAKATRGYLTFDQGVLTQLRVQNCTDPADVLHDITLLPTTHTTVASELLPLPGGGWLIDTPGVRAVSLWLSCDGIERAFADVFDLMDHCRFRDCKHDREPGCAVQQAIADGELDEVRLRSLERLTEEEAALEEEQRAREKAADRRAGGRTRPPEQSEWTD